MLYNYIIYKLIFPNGKIYVGQTKKDFNHYMNDYKSHSLNKNHNGYDRLVYRAIRKYGWNNIKQEIICTTSQEFVDELETQMIAIYKSTDRKFGYNILNEAKSSRGYKHTEKSKKKISKNLPDLKGKNNPMYGKRRMDTLERNKNNPPMLGHKHSKKSKEKIRKKLQKSISFSINNNFIKNFDSITNASIELNLTTSFICLLLKNVRKSSKGYNFKYN